MKRQPPKTSPRCNDRPFSLRFKSNVGAESRANIKKLIDGLPALFGSPICVSIRPSLKAYRGQLLSGPKKRGTPVHAASFIRGRQMILETQLLARRAKLALVVTHEVFHFVWARLGNQHRAEFTAIISTELAANARGELGESASSWKQNDRKTYVCESFCDTAAWLYSGVKTSSDFTLAARWRKKRKAWLVKRFDRIAHYDL